MEAFARLFDALDRTTSVNAKVAALVEYFRGAPADAAAWALFFLTGRRLKRLLPSRLLHEWAIACTQLPEWLVEESYGTVGDYAETIALLLESSSEYRQSWAALAAADATPDIRLYITSRACTSGRKESGSKAGRCSSISGP